ncbi:MAG TPA: L-threonylcarbamoyladenylate synthase [Vicinamibacterales bacterium]|nr:L-threonylcarbamoyladenylate synthase [Vicinamibacterales bacterium]
MQRVIVTGAAPDRDAITVAVSVLHAGGIVAMPTDTLYGLAADPWNPDAVARLFTIKNRAAEKALPLVAADTAQVRRRIGLLPRLAAQLAERFWPGPLTLVLVAPAALATEVTGGTGTVGVRVPAHDVTRTLCAAYGTPLTATSANRAGDPPTANPDVVATTIGDRIDLLVDAGPTAGGPPSTIVDVTGDEPLLIRAGAIAWDAVLAAVTPR